MSIKLSGNSYTLLISIGIAICLIFYLLISILGYYPPLPGGDDTQFWINVASGHSESTNIWSSVVSFFQVYTPNGLQTLLFLLGTLKYLVNPILVIILVQQGFTLLRINLYGKIGLAYSLLYPTIFFIIGGLYRDPLICTLSLLIYIALSNYSMISKGLTLMKLLCILVFGFAATLSISLRPHILFFFYISAIFSFSFLILKKFFKPKSLFFIGAISTLIGVSFAVTIHKDFLLALITSYEGTSDNSVFVHLINLPWLGGPLYLGVNFLYSFLALNPSNPAYIFIFLIETLPFLFALRVFYSRSNIILENPAYLYLITFMFANVLMLSLSCPNSGSSLRYRYPIFMTTVPFSLMLLNRYDKRKDSSYV
jgi:hypothetical protein